LGTQLGDIIGFLIGGWGLKRLLGSGALPPQRLQRAEALFARWGMGLLMVGRFLDGIRQTSNLAAGLLQMPWWRFLLGTLIGTSLWVGTFGLGAYLLKEDFHAMVAFLKPLGPAGLALTALLLIGLILYLIRRRRPHGTGQNDSDSRQNKIVNLNNMKRLLRKKLFVDYLCANQHNDASCLKF